MTVRYTPRMLESRDSGLPFLKMHGLGNDFVVFDGRHTSVNVTAELVSAVADRNKGVGFDQLALISEQSGVATLTFYNADGSQSAACGNATRCIARYLMDEAGLDNISLQTARGTLVARDAGDGLTTVNMGHPLLDWQDIPLSEDVNTLELPIDGAPTATGMGNPHCSFFVNDAEAIDLGLFGPTFETHSLFPQRTNVQVVSLLGPDHLRVRVWERGVGITLASGSSSCAVAVAAVRRNLTGRTVRIDLDGGTLTVEWASDGVWMTGPTAFVYSARLTPKFLEAL